MTLAEDLERLDRVKAATAEAERYGVVTVDLLRAAAVLKGVGQGEMRGVMERALCFGPGEWERMVETVTALATRREPS